MPQQHLMIVSHSMRINFLGFVHPRFERFGDKDSQSLPSNSIWCKQGTSTAEYTIHMPSQGNCLTRLVGIGERMEIHTINCVERS